MSDVDIAQSPGRSVRMPPEVFEEMAKLGFIKDRPQGKILTTSGYRKWLERTENLPTDSSLSTDSSMEVTVIAAVDENDMASSKSDLVSTTPQSFPSPPGIDGGQTPLITPATTTTTTTAPVAGTNNSSSNDVIEYCACAAEQFGGPPNAYYLCRTSGSEFIPIDRRILYLENNRLVEELSDSGNIGSSTATAAGSTVAMESPSNGAAPNAIETQATTEIMSELNQLPEMSAPSFIINTGDGQQIILDQQSLLTLASGEMPQLITADGQQIILQASPQDIISALTVNQGELGLFTGDQIIIPPEFGENSTISVAYQTGDTLIGDVLLQSQIQPPPQSDLIVNQTISTDTVLTNPIMSTLEVPTKNKDHSRTASLPLDGGLNIEDSLAVIGVTTTNSNVPSSLELPITVTNPAIASKTSPLNINTIYNTPISSIVGPISQISPQLGYDIFDTSSSSSSSKTLVSSAQENATITTISNFSASIPDQLLTTSVLGQQSQEHEDNDELPANNDDGVVPQSPETVDGGQVVEDSNPDDEISNQSDEIPIQPNNINQSFHNNGNGPGDSNEHRNNDDENRLTFNQHNAIYKYCSNINHNEHNLDNVIDTNSREGDTS